MSARAVRKALLCLGRGQMTSNNALEWTAMQRGFVTQRRASAQL